MYFRLDDEFDHIDSNELLELTQSKKENEPEEKKIEKKPLLISDDF